MILDILICNTGVSMNNLALTCIMAAISAILVTIACKTLGVGDASMVIGGGVGGAIGAVIGSRSKQTED